MGGARELQCTSVLVLTIKLIQESSSHDLFYRAVARNLCSLRQSMRKFSSPRELCEIQLSFAVAENLEGGSNLSFEMTSQVSQLSIVPISEVQSLSCGICPSEDTKSF